MKPRLLLLAATAALLIAGAPWGGARAAVRVDASVEIEADVDPAPVVHVERARNRGLGIDVWTNKEEGGIYRRGERMRVYFRPSDDAFVLIYNIDTEGGIHLIYPYGPNDPDRLEGGRTYQVPSAGDPYDLAAYGPAGVEYVVALASPYPFQNLPWYLTAGYDGPPPGYADDDYEESGVVVGDPYVGMDRVLRRVVPRGREDEVATADTYFYIERHVDYPRYVCADCHSYGGFYDPYLDNCSVVQIRIDATWARYAPLRTRLVRPRYFYTVRSTAPTRYRQWKERWSSVDGRTTLRQRFQVDGRDKFGARREMIQRRTPPEFRRTNPGRPLRGNDEVLRVRERQLREEVRERRDLRLRERQGAQPQPDRASERERLIRERRDRDRVQQELRERRDRNQRGRGREQREMRQRNEDREQAIRERQESRERELKRRDARQREIRREERPERRPSDRERARREERRESAGERVREREEKRDDRDSRGRERSESRARDRDDSREERGNGRGHRDRDR